MTTRDEAVSAAPIGTPEDARRRLDLLETAWGIIANVSDSDWTRQSHGWQDAAARWREAYHAELASR